MLAAEGVLRASEEAYQRAKAHRDLARAGVSSGLRPPIEMTRAEADLMRFDVGRVRARGGLEVSWAVLAAAVGTNEPALDASDERPEAPRLPSLEEALRIAGTVSPLILEARALEQVQGARTRALTTTLLPDLQLSGTLSGRAGGNLPSSGPLPFGRGWLPDVPNWNVGLVLVWPGFSVTALMGILMVVGIAVSNGIFLVDDASRRLNHGAEIHDAVVAAAHSRFVPIAMTSLATVIGLMPIGLEAGTEANRPLALAVVGGLVSSTVLSLYLVPVMFCFFAKRESLDPARRVEGPVVPDEDGRVPV